MFPSFKRFPWFFLACRIWVSGALGAVRVALADLSFWIIILFAHGHKWVSGAGLRTIPLFVLGILVGKLFLTIVKNYLDNGDFST